MHIENVAVNRLPSAGRCRASRTAGSTAGLTSGPPCTTS